MKPLRAIRSSLEKRRTWLNSPVWAVLFVSTAQGQVAAPAPVQSPATAAPATTTPAPESDSTRYRFVERYSVATEPGAVKAGGEDVVNEVLAGFMDFDVAVATPKMMRLVGKLGKVLGPRGLMPSPKAGSVTDDVAKAVGEFKGGKIEYRADASGNVQVRVGTAKFEEQKLAENINSFIAHVAEHRPSSVKGEFVKNIVVSSTMGPGVKVAFSAKEA